MRAFVLSIVVLWASSGWAQTQVATCGQSFSGNGYLAGDLDCSANAGDSVTISNGSLDLRGFTLTGKVRCTANCTLMSTGPIGRIVFTGRAVHVEPPDRIASLRLENVEIQGGAIYVVGGLRMIGSTVANAPELGVQVRKQYQVDLGGVARIEDSVIEDNADGGVWAEGRLHVRRSRIAGNTAVGVVSSGPMKVQESEIVDNVATGVLSAAKITVIDSIVSRNGAGVTGGLGFNSPGARISGCDVSENLGSGILVDQSGRLKLADSTVNANGADGVLAARMNVTDSTIIGNAFNGLLGRYGSVRNVTARNSTVTGNGAGCAVDTTCADIASLKEPALKNTNCGTSYELNTDPPVDWDVCAMD